MGSEVRKRRAHPARRLHTERPRSARSSGAGDPAARGRRAGRGPRARGGGRDERHKLYGREPERPRSAPQGPARSGSPLSVCDGGNPSAGGKRRGAEPRAATAAQPRNGDAPKQGTQTRQGLRGVRGRSSGCGRLTRAHWARVGCTFPDVCAPATEHPREGGWAGRARPHTARALGRGAKGAATWHALKRCRVAANAQVPAERGAVWGARAG